MSSRRSVRQLLVAVLLGVLVGGGLMAVTPAGAEVSNAVATNWKKIWKKNLKPLADKRYYTKAQSDTKYSTKAETAAGDAASQAAANAATDAKLGGYYKKTETVLEGRVRREVRSPRPSVDPRRLLRRATRSTSMFGSGSISLRRAPSPSAPATHYIRDRRPAPGRLLGHRRAPDASPGHLCVFETAADNDSAATVDRSTGAHRPADAFGVTLDATPRRDRHRHLRLRHLGRARSERASWPTASEHRGATSAR